MTNILVMLELLEDLWMTGVMLPLLNTPHMMMLKRQMFHIFQVNTGDLNFTFIYAHNPKLFKGWLIPVILKH